MELSLGVRPRCPDWMELRDDDRRHGFTGRSVEAISLRSDLVRSSLDACLVYATRTLAELLDRLVHRIGELDGRSFEIVNSSHDILLSQHDFVLAVQNFVLLVEQTPECAPAPAN